MKIGFASYLCMYLLFSGHIQAQSFLPSPYPDRVILSWQEDPVHTQAVSWRTDTSIAEGFGQIAEADASPDFRSTSTNYQAVRSDFDHGGVQAHYFSINFTDLKPSTKYAYRVGQGKQWSEWFHFSTASESPKAFSFIYFGDAQNDLKSMWSRAIREAVLQAPRASFMLHAGDLVNRADSDREWGEWFYAGGWIYGMIPSLATPGNHEYYKDPESEQRVLTPQWKPSFAFPQNGPEDFEESVYYIDYQGARIISLNSMAMMLDEVAFYKQKNWLEKVLQNNPQKWTIIMHHHPIYSAGKGRDNSRFRVELQPIYKRYGVDLVLQGHDHTYARGGNFPLGKQVREDAGPVYVVSVSGPKMYESAMSEWMDRIAMNTQLFQLIDVKKSQLNYRAYTVTGELYDAFFLQKRADGTNIFVDERPADVPERIELPERIQKRMTEELKADFDERFRQFKLRRKAVGKN